MQEYPPPAMPPAPGFAPQFRYGGFWIRVVAYIIDGIILGIVDWLRKRFPESAR